MDPCCHRYRRQKAPRAPARRPPRAPGPPCQGGAQPSKFCLLHTFASILFGVASFPCLPGFSLGEPRVFPESFRCRDVLCDSDRSPAQWVRLDSRRHSGYSWILVGTVGNPGSPAGIQEYPSDHLRPLFSFCSLRVPRLLHCFFNTCNKGTPGSPAGISVKTGCTRYCLPHLKVQVLSIPLGLSLGKTFGETTFSVLGTN